jgi:hypothetical protein
MSMRIFSIYEKRFSRVGSPESSAHWEPARDIGSGFAIHKDRRVGMGAKNCRGARGRDGIVEGPPNDPRLSRTEYRDDEFWHSE